MTQLLADSAQIIFQQYLKLMIEFLYLTGLEIKFIIATMETIEMSINSTSDLELITIIKPCRIGRYWSTSPQYSQMEMTYKPLVAPD